MVSHSSVRDSNKGRDVVFQSYQSGRAIARLALSVSSFACCAVLATAAAAQEANANAPQKAADTVENDGDIIVTGSRIRRDGFIAPTPTNIVTGEQLSLAGVNTIGDIAFKLPQFRPGRSVYTSHTGGNVGGNYFNLRGLSGAPGPSRTLTLIDGRRPTPTGSDETFDVNIIPSGIINRVEVVTGGASAAYGSDAVAGVVNLILRQDIKGFEGSLQAGQTFRYADAQEIRGDLSFGTRFAEGRGRLLISGEYYRNGGAGVVGDRRWAQPNWGLIVNPAYAPGNGQPVIITGRDARMGNATYGGLITSGPLAGTQFVKGGIATQFNPGSAPLGSAGTFGGDGANVGPTLPLLVPSERMTFFGHASFEISDAVEVWAEASYAHIFADDSHTIPSFNFGNIVIQRDNAYLPDSVRNAMAANNLDSFTMSRINQDFGFYGNTATSLYRQLSGGVKGKFGDGWTWDLSLTNGRYVQRQNYANDTIRANLTAATDAVTDPGTGRIVCRSTLTNPNNGCVPINLFGSGSPSQQAIAYVTDDFQHVQRVSQTVVEGSLRGQPFELWAGPVSVAIGAEHRSETLSYTVAPLTAAFGHGIFNGPSSGPGTIKVSEAFAEVVVPLLRDTPMFRTLDFNGAVRVADYSSTGTIFAWKLGITDQIFPDLRLRATLSRDIRAPNFSELSSTAAATFAAVRDINGTAVTVTVPTSPNPALRPEIGKTFTLGLIYEPKWAPGLRASVDYFDIRVSGAITSLTAQQIINGCATGQQDLCGRLLRNSAGALIQINNSRFNAQTLRTKGVDIALDYSVPLSNLVADSDGRLNLRVSASYTGTLKSTLLGQQIENAGTAIPHWTALGSIGYSNERTTVQLGGQYMGRVTYNATPGSAQPVGLDTPRFADRFYLDLGFQHVLINNCSTRVQLYGSIQNLLDKDPPIMPTLVGPVSPIISNYGLYDPLGRRFTLGVRFKF